jgi:hypothetical protein
MPEVSEMWRGFYEKLKVVKPDEFERNRTFRNVIVLNLKYDFWQHTAGYERERDFLMENFKEHPMLPCNRKHDGKPMNASSEQYIMQLCFLLRAFPNLDGFKILEVGGGFGGLSRILMKAVPAINSYTHYDHDDMLRFAKNFLGDMPRVHFYSIDQKEELAKQYFDLLISNYCLSETPIEYQQWVYGHLFASCTRAFIIDGDQKQPIFERELKNGLREHIGSYRVDPYPALPHQKQKIYTARAR